jgi:hypothetical protein
LDPLDYLKHIVYVNPRANSGEVRQLGRYTFGLNYCPPDPGTIYILSGETPPLKDITYSLHDFDGFIVFIPDAASK